MKIEEKIKLMEIQTNQPVRTLEATNWKAFIQSAIKTGLESSTPYKVIPYKNGIGIKKIEFIKPIESKEIKVNTKRLTSLGLIK